MAGEKYTIMLIDLILIFDHSPQVGPHWYPVTLLVSLDNSLSHSLNISFNSFSNL